MSNQIADTIIQQIGSRAFFMLGAKRIIAHPDGIAFKIGRNSKSVNHVRITLDPSDTYDVEFSWVTNRGAASILRDPVSPIVRTKIRSEASGVYADMLHDLIESKTGMYVSL